MNEMNSNKFLSDVEVDHLKATIIQFGARCPRDTLLIDLAISTGARAMEILNLTKYDLNPRASTVLIHGLKGSKDREIPLKPALFKRLMAIQTDKLFPISYSRLHQIWQEYRPAKKTFHSLRHTFAINLYSRTRDIKLVQLALGHVSLTSTAIYMDYVYSRDMLSKILE